MPTEHQRYGRTDRQTADGRMTYDSNTALALRALRGALALRALRGKNSWARTRGAQLSAGYTVNTYSKPPLYDASKCGNVTRCSWSSVTKRHCFTGRWLIVSCARDEHRRSV